MQQSITVLELIVRCNNPVVDADLAIAEGVDPVRRWMRTELATENLQNLATKPTSFGMRAEVLKVRLHISSVSALVLDLVLALTVLFLISAELLWRHERQGITGQRGD